MVKNLFSARVLRSLTRVGKSQQRQAGKLMTALLAPPKAVKAKAIKPAKAVKAAPQARARKPRAPSAAATAPASALPLRSHGRAHVPALPGRWLASHLAQPVRHDQHGAPPMQYWLYLPAHVPATAARLGLPLVVMLHGCQQTATQFAQGTRMNRLAEEKGYAVLYPQQSVSAHAQRCWKWFDKSTQEGGGSVPQIVAIIEQVCAQHAIDRRRIYIGGISAGAGMANIVALNHPQLIAAVGMHSGPVFGAGHSTMGALGVMQHGAGARVDGAVREVLERAPPFPGMPTMLIQGEGDTVVRSVNQLQLVRQALRLNGIDPATPPRAVFKPAGRGGSRHAHCISDFYVGTKVVLRVAQIAQLEHAWSGGDDSLSFNSRAGPDASRMLLDFFGRQRRLPVKAPARSMVK